MSKQKIKKLIAILLGIFICTVILIVYLSTHNLLDNHQQNHSTTSDRNESKDNESHNILEYGDPPEEDPWAYEESKLAQNEEEKKLKQITDTYSYFLTKQCLSNYYNAQTVEHALNIIDREAKETLNINQDNVSNLYYDFNKPEFCIDKIYKQRIDASKDIYVVYHRLQKNIESNSSAADTVVFIKMDRKNVDFSVYPYEYLEDANYLQLGQDDIIKINDLNEIPKNDDNGYRTSLILKDDQTCVGEFYRRYKFDIQFDVEGLYDKIDEEYKNLKYPNLDDFKRYINENREKIMNNGISKYEVNKYEDYIDYIAIDKDNSCYIFNAKNLMDYTVLLDKYTVITKEYAEQYENSFTGAQTRYCISRIMQAINDKNYEFVYQKLNPIQKNNYYREIDELKDFIINNFYEKNKWEVNDDYVVVSSNVYQYNVKITDATENEFTYREFKMTVTVKEGTDFEISITK